MYALGAEDLGGRRVGRAEVAAVSAQATFQFMSWSDLGLARTRASPSCTHSLVDDPVAVGRFVPSPSRRPLQVAPDEAGVADGHSLVVELVGDEAPALVLAADPVGHRDAHVLVEGRRRVGPAHDVQGHDREPGGVGGHQEDRDALVPGGVGVGSGGQPDVVGGGGEGGEDLLAVHDVLVAVPDRSGLERGQVGARAGLGVADGEVELARAGSRAGSGPSGPACRSA